MIPRHGSLSYRQSPRACTCAVAHWSARYEASSWFIRRHSWGSANLPRKFSWSSTAMSRYDVNSCRVPSIAACSPAAVVRTAVT